MKSKKEESEGKERALKAKRNLEETAEDAAVVGGRELAEADRPEYEARRHKTTRRPLLPTKAGMDEHYPLHPNCRSWCKHCVAGKARSNQHVQRQEEKVRLGVIWNAGSAFMSGEHNEGVHGMQPAWILYDDDKGSFWAVRIHAKGATEAMVRYGVGTIEQSGYIGERLTFKSDQELSIVALKNRLRPLGLENVFPLNRQFELQRAMG